MKIRRLNLRPFNCIAVERRQQISEFFNKFYAPLSCWLAPHRQLQSGPTLGATPHSGAAKQAPTQSVQFHFVQQSQFPLQQDTEVVSPNGQLTNRLGRPEFFATQSFDPKLA